MCIKLKIPSHVTSLNDGWIISQLYMSPPTVFQLYQTDGRVTVKALGTTASVHAGARYGTDFAFGMGTFS